MSWATRRRFIILFIIGTVAVAFLATLSISVFYKAPSCTDGIQNQGEAGVDCGGSCAYLCTELQQPPTVLFTKALQNDSGRVDVVAHIENKNANAAAKNVPYTITLYGADQALVREVAGVIDLPPGVTVPVFFPGISSGKQTATQAFLTIAGSAPRWFVLTADPRIVPIVSGVRQSGSLSAPRVEAILTNSSVVELRDVRVIVFVRSATREVIAASATIVPVVPAQGQSTATFTWNEAFRDIPASLEVVPTIPLP